MASYSDDFNRSNGAPGSDWTSVNSGTWAIVSNTLQQSDTLGEFTYLGLRWNGGAFASNDIYARVTARVPSSAPEATGMGIMVRCPTSGTDANAIDGYAIVGFTGDTWYRIEFANAIDDYTALSGSCNFDTDYTIEVRAEGSTISVLLNDSQLAQWTDTTYATGGAMLVAFGYTGTTIFDNFQAGDIASGVSVTPASAIARAGAVAPTVELGSVTATPASAIAQAAAVAPTVVLGGVSVTPASAVAVAGAIAPTVEVGGGAITPAAAVAVAAAIAPSVELGSVTVSPASAIAQAAAVAPAVLAGGVSIEPAASIAVTGAVAPTVVLGAILLAPGAASSDAGTSAPIVVYGATTATPAAAVAEAVAFAPIVIVGVIAALITLRAQRRFGLTANSEPGLSVQRDLGLSVERGDS